MRTESSDGIRFGEERGFFEEELDVYYGASALDTSAWEQDLHAQSRRHPNGSPFRRKIAGYRFMAEHCPVHIFRHYPFYFELNTGRARTDLGTGGLGGWMKREPFGKQLNESSWQWWNPCYASGLSLGWTVLDDNHHTVGYEKVLRSGLCGLIREAEKQQAVATAKKEREFLAAVIAGNQALIRIAERMAAMADQMLQSEKEPRIRTRLARIAGTARRVPAGPATSFYEALNTIVFLFYTVPSIEGNGVSVFGHVDRLLIPYYRRDIEAGTLTADEARDLIAFFLALSDARYGMRKADPWHVGTNGTITLGGCDRDGRPVFNELTRLLVKLHRELNLVDPKINARISARHPVEYFELLSECLRQGGNSLAMFNDDVVIPANARMGKALADCRLYVGGGCQENVLEECEVNSRASIYLNLPYVFLMGFAPEKSEFFTRRAGFNPAVYRAEGTFEDFYAAFLGNLRAVVNIHVDERNRTEQEGLRFNPCPLHSATLDDCLMRRKDMMEGGCRYNYGSVALTGIGTLIDSLYAVRTAVYDRHAVPLDQLRRMLASNFEGEEAFRGYLIHRIAKFGHGDEAIRAFSARIFADVARVSSGQSNSRGGRYEASLFAFNTFTSFGPKTDATPDGRKAGELLSAGMSPSLLALGRNAGISEVLAALEPLDLTLYPVVAVLDVKLPASRGGVSSQVIVPVIRRFLAGGGSVLQINCVDQALLKDARIHPEQHPDLVIRVSGYSSHFVRLAEPIQDEIIARTVVKT